MPDQVKAEWPARVLLGRRKHSTDLLREMPDSAAQSALHDTKRYVPEDTSLLADLEAEVEALKEIARKADREAQRTPLVERMERCSGQDSMARAAADRLQSLIDKHKGGADRG